MNFGIQRGQIVQAKRAN